MTNTDHERAYLGSLYGSTRKWRKKVSKMKDEQVLAIYIREHRKEAKKQKEAQVEQEKMECPQCGSDVGFTPQGNFQSYCNSCMSLIPNTDIQPEEDNS